MKKENFSEVMTEILNSKGIKVTKRTPEELESITKEDMLSNLIKTLEIDVMTEPMALKLIKRIALDENTPWA